jgi:DNA-binding CsgD family transcriptional regulator
MSDTIRDRRRSSSPKEHDQALEAEATRLLLESLPRLGRGEYPFYTDNYLRRMAERDRRTGNESQVAQPADPPRPGSVVVWQLARRARLNITEMDVVALTIEGKEPREIAHLLGLSSGRVRNILHRAIALMRACAEAVAWDMDQQIAAVRVEEESRRPPRRETHCKPGQEACRKTGLCTRRWYLREVT